MPPAAFTYLQAAEAILREDSPGAPMHYRRITELALERGLLQTTGLTPEATMVAQITTDIKRRTTGGRPARFRAFGRGLYGLATPADPLGGAIQEHNRKVRHRLRERLSGTDPVAFEYLIGELLTSLGFEDVAVTKVTGDGGVDVRATLTVGGVTDVKTAVQVKRWANNVSGKVVRELRGGLGPHERGLIITLSGFTKDAQSEASATDRTPVTLIDGEQLLDLLIENSIGVNSRAVDILQLDEESLAEGAVEESPVDDSESHLALALSHYTGGKALSMWPLPGGRYAWKDTLDAILQYVADTAPAGIS
jgi:restriction system protein